MSAAEDITGEVVLPPAAPVPTAPPPPLENGTLATAVATEQQATGTAAPQPPTDLIASSCHANSTLQRPSFEALYRSLSPYLWRVLRRLGVAERDADDVLQEVFLVVHRKLPTFEGRSSVRSFVYGIALRVASDYRRKAHRRRERVSDAPPDRQVAPNQLQNAEQLRTRAMLDQLLGHLDDKKRPVLVLYEIEQLPMDEIADAVGISTATAYARLAAGRRILKTALQEAQHAGHVGESFEERGNRRSSWPPSLLAGAAGGEPNE